MIFNNLLIKIEFNKMKILILFKNKIMVKILAKILILINKWMVMICFKVNKIMGCKRIMIIKTMWVNLIKK